MEPGSDTACQGIHPDRFFVFGGKMIRTFKTISVASGGTPAPVFGTTTTAAIAPASAPGNTQNYQQNATVNIPVTDSSFFVKGDKVNVDVGANEETAYVYAVPDSTHVTVAGLALSHASGIFIYLSGSISAVYIQTVDANSGAIYIGNKSTMVKATGVNCIAKLQPVNSGVQPIDFSSTIAGFPGPLSFNEWWYDGSTGDKILPSVSID